MCCLLLLLFSFLFSVYHIEDETFKSLWLVRRIKITIVFRLYSLAKKEDTKTRAFTLPPREKAQRRKGEGKKNSPRVFPCCGRDFEQFSIVVLPWQLLVVHHGSLIPWRDPCPVTAFNDLRQGVSPRERLDSLRLFTVLHADLSLFVVHCRNIIYCFDRQKMVLSLRTYFL